PDKQIHSIDDVLLGVGHILAETFSERADLRGRLRRIFKRSGKIVSTRIESDKKPEAAQAKVEEPQRQAAAATTEPAAVEPAPANIAHDDAAHIGPPDSKQGA